MCVDEIWYRQGYQTSRHQTSRHRCKPLLYGPPKSVTSRLQTVQNTAARLVSRGPKHHSVTPLLHQFHWLSIGQRIKFKTLLLTYKFINHLAPAYLSDLISCPSAGTLKSTSRSLLTIPPTTSAYGDRAFSVSATKLWDILPEDIKVSPNVSIFKKRLKTYLFAEAFK